MLLSASLGGCGALDFQPCAEPAGASSARPIDVPGHDRAGRVPVGRSRCSSTAYPPPGTPRAGHRPVHRRRTGADEHRPHHAALERFGGALDSRDLIVFAQRGTGPTAIHCADLEAGAAPAMAVPACAQQFGPARNFYTSRDAADSLTTSARHWVDKIAIVTASYGTWVAQGYAIRHPDHVDRMVLDSTFGPNQNADPFSVEQFKAAPALAQAICHRGYCKGITADAYADVLRLFAKLNVKPIAARVVTPDGRFRKVTLGALAVAQLIPQLDVDPNLRAELPRAVASALKGRPALLARLVAGRAHRSAGRSARRGQPDALERHPLRGGRAPVRPHGPAGPAPPAGARQARRDPSRRRSTPFGPQIAFLTSFVPTCAFWPMRAQPSFGTGAPPNVPVLLIHGEFDLRSTLASTETVAKEYPQGKVLIVPNEGHTPRARPPASAPAPPRSATSATSPAGPLSRHRRPVRAPRSCPVGEEGRRPCRRGGAHGRRRVPPVRRREPAPPGC